MKFTGSATRAVCAGLLLAGLGNPAWSRDISFAKDIRPLLVQHCVSCHQGDAAPAGLNLLPKVSYAHLVNVQSTEASMPRVTPSSPDASYLLHKLNGTHVAAGGQGAVMPLGASPLDPAQLAAIRQWISAGAPNN